jgi:type II secretory pathway component GspD/PulD (secretin)
MLPVHSLFRCSTRAPTRILNLELSALEADGKGKLVSSPRVITADKTKALIEQGTEIPVPAGHVQRRHLGLLPPRHAEAGSHAADHA